MDSARLVVDEVDCRPMMRDHFEQSSDTYSRCSLWRTFSLLRMSIGTLLSRDNHTVRCELRASSVSMRARSIASRTFSSWTRRSPVYENGYIGISFMVLRYVDRYRSIIVSIALEVCLTGVGAGKSGSCSPHQCGYQDELPGCWRGPYEYLLRR